jgi:NAD(P)H-dependent FMN reductase
VAFGGCSNGRWGGVRAIEALTLTVREMGMTACFTDVQFPKVQDTFNEAGELQDPIYRKLVQRAYDELIWMAKTMKWGRENLPRA